ncbi:MAG: hypothetical protein LC798_05385 [Chloroflexi bacterium]|nr:hypothetical protein [Chloroflexota bacterium]
MGAQILNDLTGEAALTDKDGHKYHVVFDLSAVMALEKITGKSAIDVLSNPSASDCVAMILCGTAGYGRRNPGSPKMNHNLAQKVLIDSGGLAKLAPVLAEALSCAEGLGLNGEDEDTDGQGADPLA